MMCRVVSCRVVSQVLAIQLKCYSEIIGIGHRVYRSHKLPWFRTLAWYFLFAGNYAFVGESLVDSLRIILERQARLDYDYDYDYDYDPPTILHYFQITVQFYCKLNETTSRPKRGLAFDYPAPSSHKKH